MAVYIVAASELVSEIRSAFALAACPDPAREDVRGVLEDPRLGEDLVGAVCGFMATSDDTDVYFDPDEWEEFTAYLRDAAKHFAAARQLKNLPGN